jgi:hypothetical protein
MVPPWLRRAGWFAALWMAGVAALGAVAWVLRVVMHAAGMK